VGAYVLRTDLAEVDGPVDGLYFTLVTASTVGYGDVYPTTDAGRLFALSLVVLGPATLAVAAGTLFGPLVESYFARTDAGRPSTERPDGGERVVLVADGALGERVVDALAERASLSVVTANEGWVAPLEGRVTDVSVGDPTDETALERVDLAGSTAVVVATDPEATPYAVLAVRRIAPAVRLVAVVTGDHGTDLADLGADATIDPDGLLARTTADAALERGTDAA
jgi:voltage-gated potassium channel